MTNTYLTAGTIEITSDLKIVEAGTKVGPSEAVLLNMLNISVSNNTAVGTYKAELQ